MPTPTPWVSAAEPPREEPTLRSVVMVLGNLVGSHARVVANDVARDLTQSSRALTMEGLPDRATTNLLRFWFVIAVGVVGFLLASTLANGVSMATSFAAPSASTPRATHTPTRHEMTGGTRVLIVTPLVSAPSRVAQPEPTPVAVAPAVVVPAPAPVVRAVPVVAKAPVAKAPPPPPVVAKAPPPPPANKALFADALK